MDKNHKYTVLKNGPARVGEASAETMMQTGTFILTPDDVAIDAATPGRSVAVSLAADPEFVTGRRAWIKYRELGVTAASGGAIRAQVIHAGAGKNKPTGWHLHRCDMQFLYVISGEINIAFSPKNIVRLGPGDAAMIPGGTIHQELGGPEGVEVLELTLPAEIGTENVESPWGDVEIDFSRSFRIAA